MLPTIERLLEPDIFIIIVFLGGLTMRKKFILRLFVTSLESCFNQRANDDECCKTLYEPY